MAVAVASVLVVVVVVVVAVVEMSRRNAPRSVSPSYGCFVSRVSPPLNRFAKIVRWRDRRRAKPSQVPHVSSIVGLTTPGATAAKVITGMILVVVTGTVAASLQSLD